MSGHRTPTKSSSNIHIGGLAISARTTGASGSRQGSSSVVDQTPLKSLSKELMPSLQDKNIHIRRDRIYGDIKAYQQEPKFEGSLKRLGLLTKLQNFEKSNPGLFKSLAESAPAYVDRKMRTTGTARPTTRTSTKKDDPAYIGMTNEDAVTAYFLKLVLAMDAEVTEYNESCGRSRPPKTEIPTCEYHLVDHQSKAIKGGSGLKVDFAFYYPGSTSGFSSVHILLEAKKEEYITCIHTDTLKQIADYQT
ncbi:hypothetical protein GGI16_000701 [Coemansia sp. S142-1]|nr:hypothetical protein GGI16_000701 [Coemansia sp. S142-1]